MHRVLTCLIVAVLPAFAGAQTIYKVLMPDGSVLFTDAPPPDSKVLEEREAKSAPKAAARAPRPTPVGVPGTSGESTSTGAAKERAIDAAMKEIAAAESTLQMARRKLELGREPLPGERLGLAGGGSRLSPEYEARIAGLERDVASAEARVQKAYAARNATR
jgi:Domain of unknown function (DUF4124)